MASWCKGWAEVSCSPFPACANMLCTLCRPEGFGRISQGGNTQGGGSPEAAAETAPGLAEVWCPPFQRAAAGCRFCGRWAEASPQEHDCQEHPKDPALKRVAVRKCVSLRDLGCNLYESILSLRVLSAMVRQEGEGLLEPRRTI